MWDGIVCADYTLYYTGHTQNIYTCFVQSARCRPIICVWIFHIMHIILLLWARSSLGVCTQCTVHTHHTATAAAAAAAASEPMWLHIYMAMALYLRILYSIGHTCVYRICHSSQNINLNYIKFKSIFFPLLLAGEFRSSFLFLFLVTHKRAAAKLMMVMSAKSTRENVPHTYIGKRALAKCICDMNYWGNLVDKGESDDDYDTMIVTTNRWCEISCIQVYIKFMRMEKRRTKTEK